VSRYELVLYSLRVLKMLKYELVMFLLKALKICYHHVSFFDDKTHP